ncbi:flavodoxin, long chain [Rivularia sp. PCC 7116]|uniref:flavodoxin n=1 Tax=Rivularia sp. PCC 7116 TaxID=373994 RepID=UPI00029F0A83|nr:flavodoxin [Rivularia sp. PCC 7116]AFY55450.1 flavodoxin, long chain [Rivularia sp. PCC 7116]
MAKMAIFYGSTSGITEEIATKIHEHFGEELCELFSMEEDFTSVDEMLEYDYLLFGCSTWGSGEVQNDWRDPLFEMEMDKPDFTGKTIALFGAGDYQNHGEQFVSALGTLYDHFKKLGATLVGEIPTDGYTYEYSFAVRDGKFIGLPIDEVNESDKTDERIATWLESVKPHLPSLETA